MQKPAACVLVTHALVLSVFLMVVMLMGLAASAAKHAAQRVSACPSLVCMPFFLFLFFLSQIHTHTHTRSWTALLTYFTCVTLPILNTLQLL